MTNNILDAIKNLVESPILDVREYGSSRNRANSMGAALEEYIKDLFAGTINLYGEERLERLSQVFSYSGNQNNPPDFMIRGGDAIEVKKIESIGSSLALNSSYPKHKLFSNSTMITEACRSCEDWHEKDIIYAVGVVPKNNRIKQLSFIYGMDYAANEQTYTRIKDAISQGVNNLPDIEFGNTNELARINRVDPLGITYLRVRGMWGIENPLSVFNYIYSPDETKEFNLMAIINNDKYNSFSNRGLFEGFVSTRDDISISSVAIKNPNNPIQLINSKLIKFSC